MAEEQRKIEEAQRAIALQQKRLIEMKLLKERQAKEQLRLAEKKQRSPPQEDKKAVCELSSDSQEHEEQRRKKALSLNDLRKMDINALLGSISLKRKRLI